MTEAEHPSETPATMSTTVPTTVPTTAPEQILETAAGWRDEGRRVAVATVIATWGSDRFCRNMVTTTG